MPIIAGLIAGGASVAGGLLGAAGQASAGKKAAASQLDALNFTKGVYNTSASQYQPYIGTGTNALYSLASLYGLPGAPGSTPGGASQAFQNFTQTPAYQFPLQQGNLAVNRNLAAEGLTNSGAAGKSLAAYNQGYASQGFNSYISQLAQLAGMGQQSIGSLGSIGTGTAQTVQQGSANLGGIQAGSTLGQTASLNNGLGGLLGSLGSNNLGGQTGSSFGPTSAGGQMISGIKSGLSGLFAPDTAGGTGAP